MFILLTQLITSVSKFDLLMRCIYGFQYCIRSLLQTMQFMNLTYGIQATDDGFIFKDPIILSIVS